MTKEAILYAAKSTTDVHGSIPTQLEDGRQLAENLDLTVVAEYQDEAKSAYHGNRGPGLAAAISHAEQAGASIIVQHTDRLSRGDGIQAQHLVEIWLWAQKAGVPIRSVQDDSTLENILMAAFMGERNHEDSRRKALAVEAGMRRRFERGLTNGGRRPYGYQLINTPDVNSVLSIDQAEAAIVKRIFNQADQGRSNMAIARDLQAEGVPTMRRTSYWRASTVQKILGNPVYIGKVTFQKETRDGIHQPIIDQDLWDRVKILRDDRRKSKSKGSGRPTAATHLLTRGFFRCSCGDAMAPRTYRTNQRGGTLGVYMCLRHLSHPADCGQKEIKATDVDKAVFDYFERLALDLDATRTNLAGEQNRKLDEIDALLTQARTEEALAADRLTRVKRDYTDGAITASDWQDLRTDLETEQAAAAHQVIRLTAQRSDIEQATDLIETETQLVARLTEIRNTIAGRINGADGLDAVRAVLKQTFDRFELRTTPTRPIPADVAWTGPDQLIIEPVVRDTEATTTTGLDFPHRQPLHTASKTTDAKASLRVDCFEPIRLGATR